MDEFEQLEARERELEQARKRIQELEGALSDMIDVQNGPPCVHPDRWRDAMKRAALALNEEWDG